MIRPLLIAATCLFSTASAAAPGDMFDLVCTGMQQTETGKPGIAWKERLRFDLTDRRWCRGACTASSSIAYVSADEIQIADSRAGVGGPPDVQLTISRNDGSIREAVSAGWSGSSFGIANGTCVRKPFSGIPKRKL